MAVTEARPLLLLFALTPPSAGLDQGDPLAGVLRPRGGVGVLDMIAAAVMAAPAAAPTQVSSLTQFYYVSFIHARISVKMCFLKIHNQVMVCVGGF